MGLLCLQMVLRKGGLLSVGVGEEWEPAVLAGSVRVVGLMLKKSVGLLLGMQVV